MANSGPNTNASQFFITYAKQPHLNGLYTIFGKVIHGFEVLDIMEKVYLMCYLFFFFFSFYSRSNIRSYLHVNRSHLPVII